MIRTDVPNLTPATREETFAAALPWIRREAGRVASALPPSAEFDRDDLFQVGAVVAWKLALEWDPSRSKFRTFAKLRVHGAMIDFVRSGSARGFADVGIKRRLRAGNALRVRSLSRVVASDADMGHVVTLADLVAAPAGEERSGEAEFAEILRRATGGVDDKERIAATRYFAGGKVMREVGQEMGITGSQVSQIVGRVVGRARESLRERGRNRFTAFA